MKEGRTPGVTRIKFGLRSGVLLALKCCISAVLIAWVLRSAPLAEVGAAVRKANVPLLVLAFTLNFLGYLGSAHRWRILLSAQGVTVRIPYLIRSYMVGVFLNNFLPSTIGGDMVRAYDSWRVGRKKVEAVTVILVDRFVGMLALLLFALGALLLSRTQLVDDLPHVKSWVLAGVALIVGFTLFIGRASRAALPLLGALPGAVGRRAQGGLLRLIEAFNAFRQRRSALAAALGVSLLLQLNVVLHYFLISRALGFRIPFAAFFVIIPVAIIVMMVPVSINAIGIRENTFAFFFSFFGVSEAGAVAFAWLAYGIVLFQGVIGGVVYALRK